jgi:hypothetical protein
VQAERRLERSRNATTAAVPLTEANATAFFHFRPRRARVTGLCNARWSRRAIFALHTSFSFCVIIAQTPSFFQSNSPDENVIVIFDCAQDGAIR